jgi:iron(III) transport system ATP-binding protein
LTGRVGSGAVDTPLGRFACPGIGEGAHVSVAIRLAGFDFHETHGEVPSRILSRRFLGVVEHLEMAVSGADEPVRARVRCGILPPGVRDIFLSVRPSDVLVFEREPENA